MSEVQKHPKPTIKKTNNKPHSKKIQKQVD